MCVRGSRLRSALQAVPCRKPARRPATKQPHHVARSHSQSIERANGIHRQSVEAFKNVSALFRWVPPEQEPVEQVSETQLSPVRAGEGLVVRSEEIVGRVAGNEVGYADGHRKRVSRAGVEPAAPIPGSKRAGQLLFEIPGPGHRQHS